MLLVHKFINGILQLGISAVFWLRWVVEQLPVIFDRIRERFLSAIDTIVPSRQYHIAKLPTHLGLAFLERLDPATEELFPIVELVMNAGASGIPLITVYEPYGFLKGKMNDFCRIVDQASEYYHLNFLVNGQHCGRVDGGGKPIAVIVISGVDGRRILVHSIREICRKVREKSLRPEEIGQPAIAAQLEQQGLEEPDFVVKFGEVDSMLGYPPWCLRVSEIYPVRSHRSFNHTQLLHALEQFSNRNRRFGK